MPPVGAYVNAFSVTSDRMTTSAHSPVDSHREAHLVQNSSVDARALDASTGSGGGRCDEPWIITKASDCPAVTSNSATVFRSSPCSGTGECTITMSGPAMARIAPFFSRVTHGTV